MTILKWLIAPVQAKLLEKQQCPACTRNLQTMVERESVSHETEKVTCKCGRVFLFNRATRKYSRWIQPNISRNNS